MEARRSRRPAAMGAAITRCRNCARLVAHREHIGAVKRRAFRDQSYWARPVPSFGDLDARLLIVGLAPAAHGANRTGRMFTGDRSGLWLYRALYEHGFANLPESVSRRDGLRLRGAYITAAVHCAPPDNKPTRREIERCQPFLHEEFRAFVGRGERSNAPSVVLALGALAHGACIDGLQAAGVSVPRPRPAFAHLAETRLGPFCTLLASYHPSQQNTQTGRLTAEMFDRVFARARALITSP